MTETIKLGMGWLPDYPDFRDYLIEHSPIKNILARIGLKPHKPFRAALPSTTDLRQWWPPTKHQGSLGSCTAHAALGIVEFMEKRAFKRDIDLSRLFLYKTTRKLLHWNGDTGAFLRTTMTALAHFGVPPEEYWPYEIANFDKEPPSSCYAFAKNFQGINYYRLDSPGIPKESLLTRIKVTLAAGVPSMFGFTVYDSFSEANDTGKIPFPSEGERVVGCHALVAVGFDDKIKIRNFSNPRAVETIGALLVRNSWGASWGDTGYGWLPYDYVLSGLAIDWWSLLKHEWFDTAAFGIESSSIAFGPHGTGDDPWR